MYDIITASRRTGEIRNDILDKRRCGRLQAQTEGAAEIARRVPVRGILVSGIKGRLCEVVGGRNDGKEMSRGTTELRPRDFQRHNGSGVGGGRIDP